MKSIVFIGMFICCSMQISYAQKRYELLVPPSHTRLLLEGVTVNKYIVRGSIDDIFYYLKKKPEIKIFCNTLFMEEPDSIKALLSRAKLLETESSSEHIELIVPDPDEYLEVLKAKVEDEDCETRFTSCRDTDASITASVEINCGNNSFTLSTTGDVTISIGNIPIGL